MTVSDHFKPGLSEKAQVKIMTVDTFTRRVEGTLKDGSMIQIAVWDTPQAFRWPMENEVWNVRRDQGIWVLGNRVQQSKAQGSARTPIHPITAMLPGDLKLDSNNIIDGRGYPLAAVAGQALQGDALVWNVEKDAFVPGTSGMNIPAGFITGAMIGLGAITAANVAANTITGDNIATATITSGNITTGAINGSLIAVNTITGSNIKTATITSGNIKTGTITGSLIAENTILGGPGGNIALATITSGEISTGAITGSLIAQNTISGDNIAAGTIHAGNITTGSITGDLIAINTITGDKVAGSTITGGNIATGTIAGNNIQINTIIGGPGGNIATGTITGTNIGIGTITGNLIAANTIAAGLLSAGAVVAGNIAAGAVTAGTIAANAVTAGTIAANAVTATTIAANAITATAIQASAVTATKISVATLDGISANLGTITAGNISGVTITGGMIQTSASNPKVRLSGADNAFEILDGSGTKIVQLDGTSGLQLVTGASTAITLDNALTWADSAIGGTLSGYFFSGKWSPSGTTYFTSMASYHPGNTSRSVAIGLNANAGNDTYNYVSLEMHNTGGSQYTRRLLDGNGFSQYLQTGTGLAGGPSYYSATGSFTASFSGANTSSAVVTLPFTTNVYGVASTGPVGLTPCFATVTNNGNGTATITAVSGNLGGVTGSVPVYYLIWGV